jgi:nucleotide-binding universal stress UspA family protein
MEQPENSLPIYRSILAPLDGSDRAEAALPHAAAVAQRCGARLLLLCVVQNPMVAAATMVDPVAGLAVPPAFGADALELAEEARNATFEYIQGHARALEALGISVSTDVSEGADIAEQIVEVARREGIDLIVMTTHGRTGLGRLLFGSVAESVLRRARVPVLLIRSVGEEEE